MSKDATRDYELLLLGRMIGSREYRTKCLDVLVPEDFRDKDCRDWFRLLQDVHAGREGAKEELAARCVGFADRIKAFKRARWQAAKLKTAGRYANPQDPDETNELWEKFKKDMQEPTNEPPHYGEVSEEAKAVALKAIMAQTKNSQPPATPSQPTEKAADKTSGPERRSTESASGVQKEA